MARQQAAQFRMSDPEDQFPPVEVDPRDLLQFRKNPVARELLRRIHKEIYDLGTRAFDKDEATFEERKGGVKRLKWVLEQLEDIAAGTDDVAETRDDEEVDFT